MSTFRFRFQPLLDQALEQREAAEKQLRERENTVQRHRQRIEAMELQAARRQQDLLRHRESATAFAGPAGDLIQQRAYLGRQTEELGDFRHQIFLARLQLTDAEAEALSARAVLAEARRRAETLEKYRDKLLARFRRQREEAEEAELSEIGSTLYTNRRRNEGR